MIGPRAQVTSVINNGQYAGFIDSDITGSGTVGRFKVTYELDVEGKNKTAVALRSALRSLSAGVMIITAELKYNRDVEPPTVDVLGGFSKD